MPKKLIADPKLDALVRELNHTAVAPPATADDFVQPWPPLHIPEGNPLERMLAEMAERGASDLLLLAGVPPVMRIGGRLVRSEGPELESNAIQSLLGNFLTSRIRERIQTDGAADFSVRLRRPPANDDRKSWRFRANIH